jgi:uncharacterized protein
MKQTAVVVWLLAFTLPTAVFSYSSPGSPTGYVNDFANVLSSSTTAQLESELSQLARDTSTEISVVTVPTIGNDYIENYSIKLAEEWGIGSKEHDNGVLLLIATQDRKLRIEVGYGLEGALPDSVANRIIRNDMVPELTAGSFDGAVTKGVGSIVAATKGEYSDTSSQKPHNSFLIWFIFGIFGLQWLAAILGRTKEWWLGGLLGLVGGGVLAYTNPFGLDLYTSGLAVLGLTAFGAFFDYVVSNTYHHAERYGYNPPWWVGGGSSGGSGGFGGFGGGSFGGGGASGSW